MLDNLKPVAPDPSVRAKLLFAEDSRPPNGNLGVGAYKDEQGKLPDLEAMKAAEDRLQALQSRACSIPVYRFVMPTRYRRC